MLNKIIDKKAHKEQELYFKVQSIAKSTIDYAKEIIKPGLNLVELRKMCKTKYLNLVQILFGITMLEHLYLQVMKQLGLFQEKII